MATPTPTPAPKPTPTPAPTPTPTPTPSEPVPPDEPKPPATTERVFKLVAGEGGGFTGQWSGFVLETNGRVSTWQGRDAGSAPLQAVGTATPEDRSRLWNALRNSGFFTSELNEPGNLSRSVQLEAKSENRTWTWSVAPGADRSNRDAIWSACQDLLKRVQARED